MIFAVAICRYVEALRKANFTLSEKVTVLEKASKAVIPELHSALKKSSASSKSAMKSDQSASDLVNKLADKLRSSKDNQMNQSMESVDVESANDSGKDPLTVSAQFFVKWEYTLAFDRWCDELANLMSTFKGLYSYIAYYLCGYYRFNLIACVRKYFCGE